MPMPAKLFCLVALLVMMPITAGHESVRKRQTPADEPAAAFDRGALESPPSTLGRRPLRDAVEYRPTPDYAPVGYRTSINKLKDYLSQYLSPPLGVDSYAPIAPPDNNIVNTPIHNVQPEEVCINGQSVRPDPVDCNVYQICLHEVWTKQKCADGLHYNVQMGICDWPTKAGCASNTVPESTPTLPPASLSSPAPSPSSKVICYYESWSWHRKGDGKFTPTDIDLDLCTHIMYSFAILDPQLLVMTVNDSALDTEANGPNLYSYVPHLKSKGAKVLISLGGWEDSIGEKYSRLVNDPTARRNFIDHAIVFIETYGFDGLDLDWEYPKCWKVDCSAGPSSDKPAFATFVSELRTAFNPKGWLLTAAVSPSKTVIDAGYDVPSISRDLDWIGIMTYDYHGSWDKKTGHVAPLYRHSKAEVAHFNTNFTLHYWIEQGADPSKLVMGIPLYGASFTLEDAANHGLNAPASGSGNISSAYFNLCRQIRDGGWTVVQDPEGAMGPYAYRDNVWVSYDDLDMIRRKSEIVKSMGLGGVMVWAVDEDDYRNVCGCESYPLMKTINRVLRNYPESDTKCETKSLSIPISSQSPNSVVAHKRPCLENSYKAHEHNCGTYYHCVYGEWSAYVCPNGLFWNKDHCDWPHNTNCSQSPYAPVLAPASIGVTQPLATQPPVQWSTQKPEESWQWQQPTTTTTTTPSPYPQVTVPDTGYKVICYFTNWAVYRPGAGKYTADDIDPAMCTHIIYGFATLGYEQIMQVFDSWADTDEYGHKLYAKVTAFRQKGIKVLIGLGGWNDSLGSKYSVMVNNPAARKKFTDAAVAFIEKYGFDGLDLDWEYPKCWQVDCKAGPDSDKPAFTAWVQELSAAFKPRGWLLSAAVSPSKTVIDLGYQVAEISKYLDWIGVMTYDYFGNWDKETGHVAPLYAHSQVENVFFNANFTLNYWIELGADPSKVIMGIPMYGQSFTLENPQSNGLNAKAKGPGEAGEFTRQGGFLSFYEICTKIKQGGWTVVQDPEGAMGPYAYKGNQWTSFDDVSIVRRKSELVKSMNLGGAMIWALDLDDFRNTCGCERHPLLRTINRVLRDYPVADPNCTYQ